MLQLDPPTHGYEDGLERGKQTAGKWQRSLTARLDKWIENVAEHPNRRWPRPLDTVLKDLKSYRHDDLLIHASLLHRQKMDALPDLKLFPELRGMDQYIDETARGFADGAGIDVREVYLDRYWKEMMFFIIKGKRLANDPGTCSEHWFPDTPEGPLLGKGWDDVEAWYRDDHFRPPPDPAPEPAVVQVPIGIKGRGYRRFATCNEAGFCLEQGGGAAYENESEIDRVLFPAPVNEMIWSRCATVMEALEMLTRYNVYWGPCNMVIGDADGNGAVLEKSKYNYAVRMSSRNVLVTTYGGCDDPHMRDLCDTSTSLFEYYDRRIEVMRQIVDEAEAGDGLDLEVYWQSVLHHDPQAPGCTHKETRPPGIDLYTFGAFALLPQAGRWLYKRISKENGEVRYSCENRAVETRFRF